ncbi:hypothetical protein [Paenibacillus lemnae]|nr:hypothetical protein [Paenibacillus lemnae]
MLVKMQSGDISDREPLLSMIVPYINNSVVGASKVLYFMAPQYVPIIDSRVLNTWFKLMQPYKLRKTTNSVHQDIERYIQYWDYLLEWIENTNGHASLRKLEGMLYGVNGNVSI